jgi:hypothetical protein
VEQLVKLILKKSYSRLFWGEIEPIETVKDLLNEFDNETLEAILLASEQTNFKLSTIVLWADEVVREVKAEREEKGGIGNV